jgi:hypothetical protein
MSNRNRRLLPRADCRSERPASRNSGMSAQVPSVVQRIVPTALLAALVQRGGNVRRCAHECAKES